MQIAGVQRCSFVDWPGRIVAVVFTQGCNYRCSFCHNPQLKADRASAMDAPDFLQWLDKRSGLIEGVVVSGGEPTLQQNLPAFMAEIRLRGFDVKLDTNGSRPALIRCLLRKDLVNFIAMDVKGPAAVYSDICGAEVDGAAIAESIRTIMEAGVDYEFRTTVLPRLDLDDVVAIARTIRGARRYALQEYRPTPADGRAAALPAGAHSADALERMRGAAAEWVQCCEIRGVQSAMAVTR
jgi:pyruvate formate lyase activating enzyme